MTPSLLVSRVWAPEDTRLLRELIARNVPDAEIAVVLGCTEADIAAQYRSMIIRRADHANEYSLTGREIEVLRCIARGLSAKDIARELPLSLNTIRAHSRSIYLKLGVDNRTQAALWAIANGYADTPADKESVNGA